MSRTRTGQFGIGFRRGGGQWQKDIHSLLQWTRDNDFECIDVGDKIEEIKAIADAGLGVGSVNLRVGREMLSPDKAKRDDAVARNAEFIRQCGSLAKNFFVVMIPERPDLSRKENFGFMVDSYGQLMDVLTECGGRLVIEGWPGPGALCCTPETYRAFFEAMDSRAAGVNYDPSHLLRMGIDPLRFLEEFAERVGHVHGKDTEILSERLQELGTEQPATFAPPIAFGGTHWRYCIPGHGQVRWIKAFEMLQTVGYDGMVSIELEDANFNGTEEGEKQGLILARRFLEGC